MGKHSVVLCGRLQLIKSVLMSLNVYWAMAFILPKGVIREVEKKMRTFLWKGNSAVGYPKVAWSVVCKPIEEGGQGIRDILPQQSTYESPPLECDSEQPVVHLGKMDYSYSIEA
ncbi:hypothetical protein Sango_3114200 [Sesamum angolense]|uniref:Uncharacterized protein n=1 Tax=Sesamum angolense TaxID=2727404 RepID=A0AAE1T959_9LAMI|nr:hypothetical protein Sango_3114200 [Sesamum angolense]